MMALSGSFISPIQCMHLLYDTYLKVISTDSHFISAAGLAQQSLALQLRADRLEPLKLCWLTVDTRVSLDSLLP